MVDRVELIRPGDATFDAALESILGGPPDPVLAPALPYSAIVRNNDSRAIAFLGIRFDLIGRNRTYTVVHYADTLRHPEKAELSPGKLRFVCAEPSYTTMVLRCASQVDPRGRMNLENLFRVLQARASVDCVAFADGQFCGPDSLGAFERFEQERNAELAFLAEIAHPDCAVEAALVQAMEIPTSKVRDRARIARQALARRLHEGLATGGTREMAERARNHRVRISLWR